MSILLAAYFDPIIASVSPNTGAGSGGTSITITGSHFATNVSVTIDGNPCTSVVRVSLTSITCVTPSGTVGVQDIVVTNNYPTPLTSGTSGNGLFTYEVSAPTVSAIDLDLGDTQGGELRTLTGTNFTGTTGVTVGGTAVVSFSVISATELLIVMPAHAAGASQSILVTTPGGTNAANTLYEFWSPAELTLTGYWDRGNYQDVTEGTWPGRASAGSSGGRNLIQATAANQPAEVGLEPSFDGVDDKLTTGALVPADFFGADPSNAGSIAWLTRFDNAVADGGTAAPYGTPGVQDVAGAGLALGYGDAGFRAGFYDNTTWDSVVIASPVGTMRLCLMRWDGATCEASLDGGATWSSTPQNGMSTSGASPIIVGANWASVTFQQGLTRMLCFTNTTISNPNAALLYRWAKACRGLES